jgi:hypothetical protein
LPAGRERILNVFKWIVATLLSVHLLLAILLVGRFPALFRVVAQVVERTTPDDQRGMRLAVYRHVEPSGQGWRHSTPGSFAQLDIPNTSLEAFAVWDIAKAGTYPLIFRCDDSGAVFVDGHRVIGLHGRSINNVGRAAIPLEVGPHLLVVYLRNGPASGWFTLETPVPGAESTIPLAPETLRPVRPRYFPYLWRIMEGSAA